MDQGEASFSVEFGARCVTKDGNITWLGKIEGRPDGSIAFEGTARPDRDFTTCRTGFVVLHPLEGVAGQPVRVGFTDGRFEASSVPRPDQVLQTFKSIRSLSHEVIPGVTATCTMEGDAWEIEDHRNWTDASFKTYVRLLERGFPMSSGQARRSASVSRWTCPDQALLNSRRRRMKTRSSASISGRRPAGFPSLA